MHAKELQRRPLEKEINIVDDFITCMIQMLLDHVDCFEDLCDRVTKHKHQQIVTKRSSHLLSQDLNEEDVDRIERPWLLSVFQFAQTLSICALGDQRV